MAQIGFIAPESWAGHGAEPPAEGGHSLFTFHDAPSACRPAGGGAYSLMALEVAGNPGLSSSWVPDTPPRSRMCCFPQDGIAKMWPEQRW